MADDLFDGWAERGARVRAILDDPSISPRDKTRAVRGLASELVAVATALLERIEPGSAEQVLRIHLSKHKAGRPGWRRR